MGPNANSSGFIQRGVVGNATSASNIPFAGSGNPFGQAGWPSAVEHWFSSVWNGFLVWLPYLEFLLWVLTAALVVMVIWLAINLERVKHDFKKALGIAEEQPEAGESPLALIEEEKAAVGEGSATWGQVLEHLNSANESDWRRAVLEADIMLDTMLKERGYEGDTLADRLKQVSPNDFPSVNQAWEAHRVRNQIAHEGDRFPLTQSDAKRVLNQYEAVFKEFHYI